MTEAVAKGPEEAIAQSEAHINDFLFRGGADTEAEDVEVGEKLGVGELIKAAWANAKEMEMAWLEQAAKATPAVEEHRPSSFLSGVQLPAEQPKEVVEPKPFPRRNLGLDAKPGSNRAGPLVRLIRRPDGECRCMSSEHFGQLAWQFKRMSGSSGLKVQAAICC
jgi:hypothetical protein